MNGREMNTITKSQKQSGFAIATTDTTDLSLAMLIAESEEGAYEPLAVVSTLAEAREIAQCDFRGRMPAPDNDGSRLCPVAYKIWARGIDGDHRIAGVIDALEYALA
jgi:hypothetical protein